MSTDPTTPTCHADGSPCDVCRWMDDAPTPETARLVAALRDSEAMARAFHETYERLAPRFGYETRKDSALPWDQVPAKNRTLMRATVSVVMEDAIKRAALAAAASPPDPERCENCTHTAHAGPCPYQRHDWSCECSTPAAPTDPERCAKPHCALEPSHPFHVPGHSTYSHPFTPAAPTERCPDPECDEPLVRTWYCPGCSELR